LLHLGGIHLDEAQIGIETKPQFDVFSHQAGQQVAHAFGNFVQGKQAGLKIRRTRDRKQLPYQATGLHAGFANLVGVLVGTMTRLNAADQKIAVQQNPCKQIVEIVGYPSSKTSDGF
jgi:hypothetical protein